MVSAVGVFVGLASTPAPCPTMTTDACGAAGADSDGSADVISLTAMVAVGATDAGGAVVSLTGSVLVALTRSPASAHAVTVTDATATTNITRPPVVPTGGT
jgi:glycerol-3-phosphate dehydrogenase